MTKNFENDILEKMDLIVKLLSRMNLDKDASQTDAIIQLNKIGLKPSQIAQTLDTTGNYVNVVLSKHRKKKNGKEKDDKRRYKEN